MQLRPYQKDAIKRIEEYTGTCGYVKAATGTGKSVIISHLVQRTMGFSIVCVPSIRLVKEMSEKIPNSIQISSGVGSIPVSSLGYDYLNHILRREVLVIVVCKSSFGPLVDKIHELRSVDLLVVDEAHHLKNTHLRQAVHRCGAKKVVNFTATPQGALGYLGDKIFDYTYIDGVNDGVLQPFKTRYVFEKNPNPEYITLHILFDALETGNRRYLVFHTTGSGTDYSKMSVEWYARNAEKLEACGSWSNSGPRVFVIGCTSTNVFISPGTRAELARRGYQASNMNSILNFMEYGLRDNEILILSSCRTISEGVDTRKVDGVFITKPPKSINTIYQKIGRMTRKKDHDRPGSLLILFPERDELISYCISLGNVSSSCNLERVSGYIRDLNMGSVQYKKECKIVAGGVDCDICLNPRDPTDMVKCHVCINSQCIECTTLLCNSTQTCPFCRSKFKDNIVNTYRTVDEHGEVRFKHVTALKYALAYDLEFR